MDFKLKNSNLNINVRTTQKIPETGKENDIIVISEVPMTNWILSPDAPRGAPRHDGDVWLTYSVGGNAFNALKQSTLMIAMISAKQYIDGAWVDKTAKSYQNGEWVDWIAWLYNNGDECLNVSGGWVPYAYKTSTSGSKQAAPTVTKNANTISVSQKKVSSGTYYAGALFSEKPVDLTNYNALTINVVGVSGSTTSIALAITEAKADGYKVVSEVRLNDVGEFSIDLSGITREHYVLVKIEGPSNVTTVEFSEIYLV